jgi:hypothetical protein
MVGIVIVYTQTYRTSKQVISARSSTVEYYRILPGTVYCHDAIFIVIDDRRTYRRSYCSSKSSESGDDVGN